MENLALLVAEMAVAAAGTAVGYLASAIIRKINGKLSLDVSTSRNYRKLLLLLRGTLRPYATLGMQSQLCCLTGGTLTSPRGKSAGQYSVQ